MEIIDNQYATSLVGIIPNLVVQGLFSLCSTLTTDCFFGTLVGTLIYKTAMETPYLVGFRTMFDSPHPTTHQKDFVLTCISTS